MRIQRKLFQGALAGCVTAILASHAPSADAANWFKLRGTEPGGTAHTLQVWGFIQPTYVKDYRGWYIVLRTGKAYWHPDRNQLIERALMSLPPDTALRLCSPWRTLR